MSTVDESPADVAAKGDPPAPQPAVVVNAGSSQPDGHSARAASTDAKSEASAPSLRAESPKPVGDSAANDKDAATRPSASDRGPSPRMSSSSPENVNLHRQLTFGSVQVGELDDVDEADGVVFHQESLPSPTSSRQNSQPHRLSRSKVRANKRFFFISAAEGKPTPRTFSFWSFVKFLSSLSVKCHLHFPLKFLKLSGLSSEIECY